MGEVIRIRKNFPGAIDQYVVCSDDGTPRYTWHDQAAMKQGISNIKELDGSIEIVKELRLHPDVSGMYGDTDLEKLSYAIWLWANQTRSRHMTFGYARVSTLTQAQDGNSLQAQRSQLREAGAEEIYEDVYTGTTTARPNLDRLIGSLHPGDTLIVTKLDRIARSVSQGAELIEDLIRKGVRIRILALGDAVLDDSPTGKLIRHIFLSFAEFERDMIVQRTQEGKAIARQNPGFHEGRPSKFTSAQLEHALDLLSQYSYNQVSDMTGISKSTLTRAKRKYKTS